MARGFIGARLRAGLARRGMSMAELSDLTGLPYNSILNYASDKQSPGAEALAKIRRAAGISIDWLLTGEGEMESANSNFVRRPLTLLDLQEMKTRFTNFDQVLSIKSLFDLDDVRHNLPALELEIAVEGLRALCMSCPESYRRVAGDRLPEAFTPEEALATHRNIRELQIRENRYD